MKKLYPFFLSGVIKSPIWGGTRLPCEWNKCTPDGGTDRKSVVEGEKKSPNP